MDVLCCKPHKNYIWQHHLQPDSYAMTFSISNYLSQCRELDWVGVMSYDMHTIWHNTTGHHSPLHPRDDQIGTEDYIKTVVGVQMPLKCVIYTNLTPDIVMLYSTSI